MKVISDETITNTLIKLLSTSAAPSFANQKSTSDNKDDCLNDICGSIGLDLLRCLAYLFVILSGAGTNHLPTVKLLDCARTLYVTL